MIINRAMISEIDEEKDAVIGNFISIIITINTIVNINIKLSSLFIYHYFYYYLHYLDYSNIRAEPIKQITH
jgi:hypothetical protein